MNAEALYAMAKTAALRAEQALDRPAAQGGPFFEGYGGYTVFANEYNRLLSLAAKEWGTEVTDSLPPIDLKGAWNPADALGAMWRSYLELAASRLNALAIFLHTKLDRPEKEAVSLVDLIRANLRPAIYEDPTNERAVQDVLETIFRARGFDYSRDKVSIEYSSKTFKPDFTFDSLGIALEVKYCNRDGREKEIIDEINADIPAYRTKYAKQVFTIYDLGFIRDEVLFKSGIEDQSDVYVVVVKK